MKTKKTTRKIKEQKVKKAPVNHQNKKNGNASIPERKLPETEAENHEYVDIDIADATEGFGGGEIMSNKNKKRK